MPFLCSIIVIYLVQLSQYDCYNILSSAIHNIGDHYVILPVNALGLANRLRIISSLYTISIAERLKLIVVWGESSDCLSKFDDLFVGSPISVISLDEDQSRSAVFENLIRSAVSDIRNDFNMSTKELFLRDFVVKEDWQSTQINVVWTRGTHAPADANCGNYLYAKNNFYRQLIPSSAVQALINSAENSWSGGAGSSNFGGMVVGVHIRAFDSEHDWAVVSPSLSSSDAAQMRVGGGGDSDVTLQLQAQRFDQTAPLESFVAIMTQIIAQNENVRFFVASNSARAKELIVQHFGAQRVLTLQSDSIGLRSSTAGIIVAAAEFLLLGNTAFIIHTRGSSFAREAAARFMLPVIDVRMHTLFINFNSITTIASQLLLISFTAYLIVGFIGRYKWQSTVFLLSARVFERLCDARVHTICCNWP